MKLQSVIVLICLVPLSALGNAQELSSIHDVDESMMVEIDYSGQRRHLSWGTGGFSWLLYTMHLCHGPGPICPAPPCGIGPRHHEWDCNSTDSSSVEADYETTEEENGNSRSGNDQSGNEGGGYSRFNALFYIIAGAAVAAIVAGFLFKKRRGRVESGQDIEGSVARHMELLEKGEAVDIPAGEPPQFIEMPTIATTSQGGIDGGPTTNYAHV